MSDHGLDHTPVILVACNFSAQPKVVSFRNSVRLHVSVWDELRCLSIETESAVYMLDAVPLEPYGIVVGALLSAY